ncbi:MAG: universal stress protein [Alphaproteobacteria bacterium]|nr:universal stress protein [Alphaproteobacteria bacterium]
MTIRTILAPVSGLDQDDATLATAFTVADAFDAHVDVLFAEASAAEAVPMVGEGVSSTVIEQLMRAAEREVSRRKEQAQETYAAARQRAGVGEHDTPPGPGRASAAWRLAEGREDEVVARSGHLTDLVVLGRPGDGDDVQPTLTLEAALMNGARPILLAPRAAPESLGRAVAIAWNGGAECARAVHGAMPFLEKAQAVHVLTCETSRTDKAVAQELVDYLAWHGIDARSTILEPGDREVGATVLETAADLGCDLVVMGGYSHSRVREMIFGGVTRFVLAHAALPVLMAH